MERFPTCRRPSVRKKSSGNGLEQPDPLPLYSDLGHEFSPLQPDHFPTIRCCRALSGTPGPFRGLTLHFNRIARESPRALAVGMRQDRVGARWPGRCNGNGLWGTIGNVLARAGIPAIVPSVSWRLQPIPAIKQANQAPMRP